MQKKRLLSNIEFLIQIVFTLLWLYTLFYTDSFVIIYYLCAALSIYSMKFCAPKAGTMSTKKSIAIDLVSLGFSFAVVLSNYSSYNLLFEGIPAWLEPFKFFLPVLGLIGGFIVGRNIVIYMDQKFPSVKILPRADLTAKKRLFFILGILMLFLIADFTYFIMVGYPGFLSPDSLDQLKQSLYGYTSNHHPFWHTLIVSWAVHFGLAVFNDMNAAVACYSAVSIVFISACFTYAFYTLYEIGVPKKVLLGTAVFCALVPYNISYSMTMWKDVFFGGAAIIVVVTLYRIIFSVGRKQWLNYLVLGAGAAAFCIWRTNGRYALVFVILVLAGLRIGKKKIYPGPVMGVLIISVLVGWIMCGPVIEHIGLKQPDFIEAISIPSQQIARVVADECVLTEEELETISRYISIPDITYTYIPFISDPIKNALRKNSEYMDAHKMEFLQLWVKLGLKYPTEYIMAWVDQTKGYWNGGYDYWYLYEFLNDNDMNITSLSYNNPTSLWLATYIKGTSKSALMQPFRSIGLHVWILLSLTAIGIMNKRKETVICLPIIGVWLTLLIATPVYSEFRYIYSLFTTLPFIALVFYTAGAETSDQKE